MKLSEVIRAQPRWVLLIESLALLLAIGFVDTETGWEWSMFAFYAVPILMAVWFVDRSSGVAFAVLGALIWWLANKTEHPYQSTLGYQMATFSRLVYFLFVAIGGAALKTHRDADRARITAMERTRQLEEEIVRVTEREQQRIGRDLHDGLCQYLAAVGISAKSLADDLAHESAPHAKEAREIEGLLKEAVSQARSLARGIFPVQMDGAGLSIALDEMVGVTRRLASMNVRFEETGDTHIADPVIGTQLYRIAQEALSNAMKHSGANRIVVSLHGEDGAIRLVISDDGKGFPGKPESSSGLGLGTMRYRAHSIGADFDIASSAKDGTRIMCKAPLAQPKAREAHA
ncbi:MAG: sensor histidine kinase [Chthoniobacteraceae bacterium]